MNAKHIVGGALDLLLQHGDIVAVLCFAAALLLLVAIIVDAVRHRRRRRQQRLVAAGSGERSAPRRSRAARTGIVTAVPVRARPLSPEMRREPALIVPSRRTDGIGSTRPPAAAAH